jgi:hypothetical protein
MEYATDTVAQAAYVTNATHGSDILTDGTASANSYYGANTPNLAVDNNGATFWQCYNVALPYYWKYDLGSGVTKIVSRFTIESYDVYAPNAFNIQGSNDDTNWTTLYSGSVVNNANKQTFNFSNSKAYRYYKLNITSLYQVNNVVIEEMEMMELALQTFSESSIKNQGSYALKGVATTDALNKTLTRTISSPIDLSGIDTVQFDIRSSRTGSNIKIGIHDSGGTTTEITPNITSADTWETVVWDISAVASANKDAIDSIIVTITNADSANTFYIDNFLSAENVTVTAEPFIVTTSLSSDGAVILAGFGYVYEEDSSGAVMDVAVRTKTNVGKNILKRKALKYIYHMMNTHGKDVTMTIYVDGTAQTPTFTINTTVRKMTRIEDLPSFEGYKFDIRLTCNDITDDDLEIYSPVALQYVPYGE